MWSKVRKQFSSQKVRLDVVRKMLEYGIRVSQDDRLFIGGLEVDYSALARDVGADRRVVKQTAEQIRRDEFLFSVFSRITPVGANLVPVVGRLGYSAIVIEADPHAAGVISAVTEVLSRHKIVVKQALADDPDLIPEARLTLVVGGELSSEVLKELNSLDLIRSLTVRK
jgi:uncharacterized protein